MADKNLTFSIFGKDKTASKSIRGVSNSATHLRRSLLKVGAAMLGVFSIRQIGRWAASTVREFADAERGQQRLTDAFERFPKVGNVNIQVLRNLNTTIQKKTQFDDDALAAAEAQLAQYKLSGKQLLELTPLVADYAAKTGKDLPASSKAAGLALLGNGRALKAIGVNFKDTGSLTGNYTALVKALREQVGGFAEKEGQTYWGLLERIKLSTGEIKETVGSAFAPSLSLIANLLNDRVLPAVAKLTDKYAPKIDKWLQGGAQKIGDFLDSLEANGVSGTIGPVLPQIADGLVQIGTALTQKEVLSSLTTLVTEVLPPLVDLLVALAPAIPPIASLLTNVLVPSLYDTAAQTRLWVDLLNIVSGQKPFSSLVGDLLKSQGPWADGQRALLNTFVITGNFIVGVANMIIGAIEGIINAIASLTHMGASVHLPRISSVVGYSVTKPGGGSGGNGTSHTSSKTQYASGGLFTAKPGGYFGTFGEGKHDEVALPLSSDVYQRLGHGIAAAGGGAGGGVQIVLQMAPGTVIGNYTEFMRWLEMASRKASKHGAPKLSFEN